MIVLGLVPGGALLVGLDGALHRLQQVFIGAGISCVVMAAGPTSPTPSCARAEHAVNELHMILVLVLIIVRRSVVAKWTRQPYPIVFLLGGIVLAFVPGMPVIQLDARSRISACSCRR